METRTHDSKRQLFRVLHEDRNRQHLAIVPVNHRKRLGRGLEIGADLDGVGVVAAQAATDDAVPGVDELVEVAEDVVTDGAALVPLGDLLAKRDGDAADTTGVVSSLFGVYDDATGLALRGTFVISPEGKLVSATVNFYNVGRNMEELVRVMEANVHCAANPAEACPAKWTPGEKTLTPNEGMVGNVYEALNG